MKKKFVAVLLVLVFGIFFSGCASGPQVSNTVETQEPIPFVPPTPTIFEGTWTWTFQDGSGYTFSGSSVTQFRAFPPGTFTFTDTTITFQMPYDEWTMGYVLTDSGLELIRLPGDDDNWYGQLIKTSSVSEVDPTPTIFEGTWTFPGNGSGFTFSGSSVTQFDALPGTFTFTDATITFQWPHGERTMGYVLTGRYLDLIRLPGDDNSYHGRLINPSRAAAAEDNTEPKTINITGFGSRTGNVNLLVLNDGGGGIAIGQGIIRNGSATVELFDYYFAGDPFAETGSFKISMRIQNVSSSYFYTNGKSFDELDINGWDDVWSGKMPKFKIENAESTIDFSLFFLNVF